MNAPAVSYLHEDRGSAAWDAETDGWLLHLDALRRSPETLRNYRAALGGFRAAVEATGRSVDPARVERPDVERWLVALREGGTGPASVQSRYRVVKGFFGWLVEEGVLGRSPFAGVPKPKAPTPETPTLEAEAIGKLLATCHGRSFAALRDRAIVLLMLDAGLRRSEVCGLLVTDVDLKLGEARIIGKGEKRRLARFGPDTADALSRYITRARADHPRAERAEPVAYGRVGLPLWLGAGPDGGPSRRGALDGSSLYRMLERRARAAGIGPIHPHMFRHTWTDGLLSSGHEEGDVMTLGGWADRAMLNRYGAVQRARRASAHYRSPVSELWSREAKSKR